MSLTKKLTHHFPLLLVVLVALVLPVIAAMPGKLHAADNNPDTQQELDEINQAIGQIENWLAQAISERPEFEQHLAEIDQKVNEVGLSSTATRASIALTTTELNQLQRRARTLADDKQEQTELVSKAIRAAYMEGSQGHLKLLLNQEDPALAARILHYYRSFNEDRLELINQYQVTLEALTETEQQLREINKALENEQMILDAQLVELTEARQTRQLVLSELDAAITLRSSDLNILLADRATLEELIVQVNRAIENIPAPNEQSLFATLKGKLPWPGQGELINQFGAIYGDGNLERQGITIASIEGSPVRAVHGGRVVFADWLRGSGLLLIIDHGEGYMSLYAHNETLTRKTGAWVNAGESIATVGNSGGQAETGIYFEIRYNGTPQNPGDWFAPRG
jgi:septal ring factor EnvC (AmiA/AmiB activator)